MEHMEIKVVASLNEYELVINKGSNDGIKINDKFIIYNLGEELFDPDTKESLGHVELVCGKAKPKHIQPKLTTLISNDFEPPKITTTRREGSILSFTPTEIVEEVDPNSDRIEFDNVKIGSLVKKYK